MKWTDAQTDAIQSTGQDLCVTASAGSGKTAVLVERVLHLVRECQVSLERIVAITFTEKAAAEMKDRLRSECRDREHSGSQEEMERWRGLARQIESARMSTIHAFCARLLRQYALDYRITPPLDPDFTVVDDAESCLLRAEVIDTAIEALLEQPHEETLRLAAHYGLYRLKEMLGSFLHNPVTAGRLLASDRFTSPDSIRKFWRERVDEACRARLLGLGASPALRKFRRVFERFDGLCTNPADGREQFRLACLRFIDEANRLRNPQKIEWLLRGCLGGRLPSTAKANWVSEQAFEDIKEAQDAFKKVLQDYVTPTEDPEVEQQSAELTRDAVACFRAVFDYYRAAKAARNALDFTDLILLTLDMLQCQPELRERIARGIDHLLIDEFQDTDSEQYTIARLLCGTPDPPELFIVGDAKQSIYRFRGAEVEVFETAKTQGRTIGLHRNFRTVPEIVAFVNEIFTRTDLLEAVESPYVPAEAHRAPTGECRVHILLPACSDIKESVEETRTREAAMIGDWIAAACSGQLDVQLQPKGSDAKRPAAFGDIALLLRALSDVHIYERALAERRIPFHVIAGKGFYERQEVLDVRNLLEAVVDPWHEPAVLGFLRSPMAGLDDDSLFAICGGPGPTAALLDGETPPGFTQCDELDNARRVFQALRAERERSLPDFLRYLLELTGYEAMVGGLFLGDQRACNVRKVMQLAEAFAKTRRPRLSAFVRYLDDVASAEIDEGEAALQAEGSDEVTIMSIHKSKGLEFPIVILPDLSRGAGGGGQSDRVVFHRQLGVVARPYDPRKNRAPAPQIYEVMKRDEKAKDEAERARILYVATTRARDWLVLSGSAGSGGRARVPADSLLEPIGREWDLAAKPDETLLSGAGWTALVRRAMPAAAIAAAPREPARPLDMAGLAPRLERAPAIPATQRTFAVTTLVHRMYPSDEAPAADGPRDASTLDPLLRGTLVHRYFELWDFRNAPPDIDAFLRREQPAVHLAGRLREAIERAARGLMASGAWPLLTGANEIEREAPFLLRVGDAVLEGVIDAVLDRDALLDYKTGLHRESRRGMYDAQLCLYAEAMRRLQGRAPGKAWVYYVDSGELAETDISPERTADVLKHAAETIDTLRNEPMPDAMEVYLK